jgi:hypothetical protein
VPMQQRAILGLIREERRSDGEEGRKTGNSRRGETRRQGESSRRVNKDDKARTAGAYEEWAREADAWCVGGRGRQRGWRWATIARFRAQHTHHPTTQILMQYSWTIIVSETRYHGLEFDTT